MAFLKSEAFPPQFEDVNGRPLVLGTIEFYVWNTTTPTPIYFDAGGVASAVLVTLDLNGRPTNGGDAVDLFYDSAVSYKIVRKDAAGSIISPVIGPFTVDPLRADLSGPGGSALIGHDGGTVASALDDLEETDQELLFPQAAGPAGTSPDPEDRYSIYRRFQELHKFDTANIEPMAEDRALRAGRNSRATVLKRDTTFSVANGALTAVQWDAVTYDGAGSWLASTPTRLTVPEGVVAVRLAAMISFVSNSTGIRAVEIRKNGTAIAGGRISVPAVNGLYTAVPLVSNIVPVEEGDYFEIFAFQNSGGALDADVFSTFEMELVAWGAGNYLPKRLLIAQGLYQEYEGGDGTTDSNLDAVAGEMAQYSIIVLSHASTYSVTGCVDSKYDYIVRLIRTIRNINPQAKIYGYIEGTASAPSGCGYAPGTTYADTGWSVPVATEEINRILVWHRLEGARPDGIFIDLVAPAYMSAAHRDNVFSACKGYGFGIMANTTIPGTLNTRFPCESEYFTAGDFVCIEGFVVAGGQTSISGTPVLNLTNDSLAELARWRPKGIRLAALCSEAAATSEGQTTNIGSSNNVSATTLFNNFYVRGDVYQYDTADLGIVSKIVQTPGI